MDEDEHDRLAVGLFDEVEFLPRVVAEDALHFESRQLLADLRAREHWLLLFLVLGRSGRTDQDQGRGRKGERSVHDDDLVPDTPAAGIAAVRREYSPRHVNRSARHGKRAFE